MLSPFLLDVSELLFLPFGATVGFEVYGVREWINGTVPRVTVNGGKIDPLCIAEFWRSRVFRSLRRLGRAIDHQGRQRYEGRRFSLGGFLIW